MIRLDEHFLREAGLGSLPEDDKHSLLKRLYAELEVRVGEALTDGLSQSQLDEFESIIDGHPPTVHAVLVRRCPAALEKIQGLSDRECKELAADEWLKENRPDHQSTVRAHFLVLKAELVAMAPTMVATS